MSKIDVVMITTGNRPDLLTQSLASMVNNAEDVNFNLVLVVDGDSDSQVANVKTAFAKSDVLPNFTIYNCPPVKASAARNIGASSIPKYRRGSHVCFFDDDIYAVKGWDTALLNLSKALPGALCSGHGHPYNHGEPGGDVDACIPPHTKPLVISTVNFFMPWAMWDHVGFFVEPGGAGGSEDFDWCRRASALGYGFAVTEPQVILHTGLTSSTGKQIVGYNEMRAQNERLIQTHGLKGVIWQ